MSIDHDRYGACHAQKEKSARKSLKEGVLESLRIANREEWED